MKHFYIFFPFLTLLIISIGSIQAQIVNIPDPEFKNILIAHGVDTNGDGEIQVSEAQAVQTLHFAWNSITSMVGIEAFTNLTTLNCKYGSLTSLDVSNCPNLTYLVCSENNIVSLNLANNTNLTHLECELNDITSLDVSDCTSLSYLTCQYNLISSLDFTNNPNLAYLDCGQNNLVNLNIANNLALQYLNCSQNQISILNTTNLANLQTLYCGQNLITTLDLPPLVNLVHLDCSINPLVNFDITNNILLESLGCLFLNLTSIDVSNKPNLKILSCSNNPISQLDVSNNVNLEHLNCGNLDITTLDVSNNPNLRTLDCSSNTGMTNLDVSQNPILENLFCNSSGLEYINVKNGYTCYHFYFTFCPNLKYICATPSQIPIISQKAEMNSNITLNDLCSYTPGGFFNTVSGESLFDANTNGCDTSDITCTYLPIQIQTGANPSYAYTNQLGNYTAYLGASTYTLTPYFENPAYYSANAVTYNFQGNTNNVLSNDFCIIPNGNFADVTVSIIPITIGRPGFNGQYEIHFSNNGTIPANGLITLDIIGSKVIFINSSIPLYNQTTNQLTWAYTNLLPLETRSILLDVNLLPPPINNINTILPFSAEISMLNDVNYYDNFATLNQLLIGAFDPNDITCLEGDTVSNSYIGKYLHYMIRFQNTGNYLAENVVIVDTLDDTKYDLQSLQMIETSHPCHIDLRGKVLQFYYENIQLADSFSNEPESHGYVVYKIKTKGDLPQNSQVYNQAGIYFDYNPPVITNLENTAFTWPAGIVNPQTPPFRCFPNPAQNYLTIECTNPSTFLIISSIGKIIKTEQISQTTSISIEALPQGVYLLKEINSKVGTTFVKNSE